MAGVSEVRGDAFVADVQQRTTSTRAEDAFFT
jgi:hypothetical protein